MRIKILRILSYLIISLKGVTLTDTGSTKKNPKSIENQRPSKNSKKADPPEKMSKKVEPSKNKNENKIELESRLTEKYPPPRYIYFQNKETGVQEVLEYPIPALYYFLFEEFHGSVLFNDVRKYKKFRSLFDIHYVNVFKKYNISFYDSLFININIKNMKEKKNIKEIKNSSFSTSSYLKEYQEYLKTLQNYKSNNLDTDLLKTIAFILSIPYYRTIMNSIYNLCPLSHELKLISAPQNKQIQLCKTPLVHHLWTRTRDILEFTNSIFKNLQHSFFKDSRSNEMRHEFLIHYNLKYCRLCNAPAGPGVPESKHIIIYPVPVTELFDKEMYLYNLFLRNIFSEGVPRFCMRHSVTDTFNNFNRSTNKTDSVNNKIGDWNSELALPLELPFFVGCNSKSSVFNLYSIKKVVDYHGRIIGDYHLRSVVISDLSSGIRYFSRDRDTSLINGDISLINEDKGDKNEWSEYFCGESSKKVDFEVFYRLFNSNKCVFYYDRSF